MKKLIWIALALTLLLLVPGVAAVAAAPVAATATWLGGHPIVVAFLLGMAARQWMKPKQAE